jgi:hypothetical protein
MLNEIATRRSRNELRTLWNVILILNHLVR